MRRYLFGLATSVLALAALAACGGDDGSADLAAGGGGVAPPPPPTTAEGVYGGTVTGAPSGASAFEAVVLENGDIWALYGQNAGSIFNVYGLIQGSGTSSNGSYTSANARDFGVVPAASGSISATYNAAAGTLAGSASGSGLTMQFSGGPIPGSSYNYNSAASLSTVAGSWSLQTLQGDFLTMNVSSGGSLTFTGSSGCGGTGSFMPRASGKNVFNVSITFGNSRACPLPGQTVTGIGITYPITATSQSQLVVAVTDSARTLGTAAFGIR